MSLSDDIYNYGFDYPGNYNDDYDYDDYDESDDYDRNYPASDVRTDDRKSYENGSRHFQRYGTYAHGRDLLAELASQREAGELIDVVVTVQRRRFPCHRAVLASTPYFKAMFSSKLSERKSRAIRLRGINANSFSKILDFLYTGEICIYEDDVQDILQAAHMLLFDKITEYCRKFIQDNHCLSNCLGVMQLADRYGFSELEKEARNQAVSNFSEIVQNEEFLTISKQTLLVLLTNENLPVTSEDDVVSSAIRWLDHDPNGRKTALVNILQTIHLSCVRVKVLEGLETHPVVRQSAECLATITAAKEEHLNGTKELQASAQEFMTKSRPRLGISDDLAILVGGWDADTMLENDRHEASTQPTPMQRIICVDTDTRQCYHITDLPTPVAGYMSVTCAERRLYVTGGSILPVLGEGPQTVTAPCRQAFQYDIVTDTWMALTDMPAGRAGHQSVVVDEKLFLVGGDVEETSKMFIDCYDLEKDGVNEVIEMINSYKVEEDSKIVIVQEYIPLPSPVFGYSFLEVKKSSIMWYCKDFTKVENEKDWT
ncbi:kelch-like protein 30 [Branchiostoma floridae x Branchiostoma japonicum]